MSWGFAMKDETLLRDFGSRIRKLRKQRRWTQKELAANMGVQTPQLNKYECGLHAPPLDRLLCLAEMLETSVDFLLTGHESEERPLHNFRLLERFRALENFQQEDRDTIIRLIDALIIKNRAEGLLDLPR